MPIYEYQCCKCGQFESFQRITDKPLTRCPTCQGKVTKLISQSSFHLKGTGWYATDYGRKESGDGKPIERKGTTDGGGSGISKDSGDGKPSASKAGPDGSGSGASKKGGGTSSASSSSSSKGASAGSEAA